MKKRKVGVQRKKRKQGITGKKRLIVYPGMGEEDAAHTHG